MFMPTTSHVDKKCLKQNKKKGLVIKYSHSGAEKQHHLFKNSHVYRAKRKTQDAD